MVLEIIRIFDGPFSGSVLYDNPDYITPNTIRKQLKLKAAGKYENRQMQKQEAEIKEVLFPIFIFSKIKFSGHDSKCQDRRPSW